MNKTLQHKILAAVIAAKQYLAYTQQIQYLLKIIIQ